MRPYKRISNIGARFARVQIASRAWSVRSKATCIVVSSRKVSLISLDTMLISWRKEPWSRIKCTFKASRLQWSELLTTTSTLAFFDFCLEELAGWETGLNFLAQFFDQTEITRFSEPSSLKSLCQGRSFDHVFTRFCLTSLRTIFLSSSGYNLIHICPFLSFISNRCDMYTLYLMHFYWFQ
jgi:hypothetical protein